MDNRKITTDDLTAAAANALGKTPEEIKTSETFEQAVYDLAKSSLPNLPTQDFTGRAQYSIQDEKISIKYHRKSTFTAEDISENEEESAFEQLATFYNSYFPDTQPSVTIGEFSCWFKFSSAPFIEKAIPAMKLWKQSPSELQSALHEDIEASKRGPEVKKIERILAYC